MADFYSIESIIDDAISLDLGNPNFSISEKEALIKKSAIRLGTMDYYRTFPMRIDFCTSYSSSTKGVSTFDWNGLTNPRVENGMLIIPFNDVFTKGAPRVPEDQVKNAHFLGVMRMERPAWNTWSNPSMWDFQMLGVQVNNSNFDIMKTLLSNTLDDLSTGQPRYTINRMANRIEVMQPWGFGLLSLACAIGFFSPEYVEMSRVDQLCKFISYRFIESIIQARAGVELDADFKISTKALEDRLSRLREEVDSIKNLSVLSTGMWS